MEVKQVSKDSELKALSEKITSSIMITDQEEEEEELDDDDDYDSE